MSSKHTQGRLEVYEHSDGHTLIPEGGSWLYGNDLLGGAPGNACYIVNEADARRLAACWNACEGLTTNQLESMLPVLVHITGEGYHIACLSVERDHLRTDLTIARALLAEIIASEDKLIAQYEKLGMHGGSDIDCQLKERIRAFLKGQL